MDTSNFFLQWQVNMQRCLEGAQNVFATLGRGVFVHCKDRGQTHILLEGNSAEMLPRLGAESNLQLDEHSFCNSIENFQIFQNSLFDCPGSSTSSLT